MFGECGEDFGRGGRVSRDLQHFVVGRRVPASMSFGLARHGSTRVVLPLGGGLFLAARHRQMALEAVDLAKAGTVPRDLICPKEDASAGDEDGLMTVCAIDGAVDMVDPVAAQGTVREGYELGLIIAPGVDRPGKVDVDGDNAVVWC